MSQNYNLTVNGEQSFIFTIDDLKDLDIISTSQDGFHLLKDNKSYHILFIKNGIEEKHYKVEINHHLYEVKIDDELDIMIKKMGMESGSTKHITELHAPMPGLILDIIVEKGQLVKENDSLLILEAMKMENSVVSPRDGIIKKIKVNNGDAVDKGQVLIEYEK